MAPKTLFQGIKFWLSAGVPMRKSFADDIRARGGEIVRLEQQADMLIVDHKKKNNPANSFSFTFIDRSIKNGALEDSEDHRATPASLAPRPAGSVSQAAKATRTPFTNEDDKVLLDWVWSNTTSGGKDAGNAIFQQLGTITTGALPVHLFQMSLRRFGSLNKRHTWQAWRDRYVKKYRNVPVKVIPVDVRLPSPPIVEIVNSTGISSQPSRHKSRELAMAKERREGIGTSHVVMEESSRTGNLTGDERKSPARARNHTQKPAGEVGSPENSIKNVRFAVGANEVVSSLESGQSSHATEPEALSSQHKANSDALEDDEFHRQKRIWLSILQNEEVDVKDYTVAAELLGSTESILNLDDNWERAWKRFARKHSDIGKTWEEWADYWTTTIRPIYEKRIDEVKEKLEKTESTGSIVAPSSPRGLSASQDTKNQIHLEKRAAKDALEPESKTIKEGLSMLETAMKSQNGETVHPPGQRPIKRKIIEESWDEIPDGLPLKALPSGASKRQRIEVTPPNIEDEDEDDNKDQSEDEVEEVSSGSDNEDDDDDDDNYEDEDADEDNESSIGYPDLPPDSDNETDKNPGKQHYSSSTFAVSNDQSQHASRESDVSESLFVGSDPEPDQLQTQLPSILPARSKRDTQQEVDAQIFFESSFRLPSEPNEDEPSEPEVAVSGHDTQKNSPLRSKIAQTDSDSMPQEPSPKPAKSQHKDPEFPSSELFIRTPSPPTGSFPPNSSSSMQEDSTAQGLSHATGTDGPSQAKSEDSTASLDRWLDHFLEQGVAYDTLLTALTSTSMNPVLADAVVMEMEKNGNQEIPGDMEGVWTSADDACLKSRNPKMVEVVRVKHGDESLEQRIEFHKNCEDAALR